MANQNTVEFGDIFYLKHESSCPIVYGDRITNSDSHQRLASDTTYQGYTLPKFIFPGDR